MSSTTVGSAPGSRSTAHRALHVALCLLLFLSSRTAGAQIRERPVPFDEAGRITAITPPLAARLGLASPAWPVSGEYVDARLYAADDTSGTAVIVVRRQREVLERYPLTATQRRELAATIARSVATARAEGRPDAAPAVISDPVTVPFVVNQGVLGALLFGPSAAAIFDQPASASAAYLAVAGGTFFLAANHVRRASVSRAQNHLSWHLARQGAAAGALATFALTGDDPDNSVVAGAMLVGGIVGDVVGLGLARPMTDAEAHGFSHGGTLTATLASGAFGAAGMYGNESKARGAAAGIVAAGLIGYPLGLRYARRTAYQVTAGDVGTLAVGELLGFSTAITLLPNADISAEQGFTLVTAGYAIGALLADRAVVRRFDYTESESRILQLGTIAGGVIGVAVPVLAGATDNERAVVGAATLGGLLGAVVTHKLLAPQRARARDAQPQRTGLGGTPDGGRDERFTLRVTPQNLLLAARGARGVYPVVSLGF